MATEQWFAVRMRKQIDPEGSIIAVVKVDDTLAKRAQASYAAMRSCDADEIRFVVPVGVFGPGFVPADGSPRSNEIVHRAEEMSDEMWAAESGDPDTDDTEAWCRKVGSNLGEGISAGRTPKVGEVSLIISSPGYVWLSCEDTTSPQWYECVETMPLAKALGIYDLAGSSPLTRTDVGESAQGTESAEPSIADGPVEAACPCCDSRNLRACYAASMTQGVTGWVVRDGVACDVSYDGNEQTHDVRSTGDVVCDGCDSEWCAEQLTLYRDGNAVRRGDAGPAVTDHSHPRHGGLAP